MHIDRRSRMGLLAVLLSVFVLGAVGAHGAPGATPGVTDQEIVLGMWAPFTGVLSPSGVASRDGLRVWAAEVNAKGGIHGRRVRMVFYDDAASPPEAVAAVRRLLTQDRVFALLHALEPEGAYQADRAKPSIVLAPAAE